MRTMLIFGMSIAVAAAAAYTVPWPASATTKVGGVAQSVPMDLTFGIRAMPTADGQGVGADGAKSGMVEMPSKVSLTTDQTGILLSESQYADMTNAIAVLSAFAARQWALIHSNAQMRAQFHGGIVSQYVQTNAAGMLEPYTLYRDGYEFAEPVRLVQSVRRRVVLPSTNAVAQTASQRLALIRAARAAARAAATATTNEVTVTVRPQ